MLNAPHKLRLCMIFLGLSLLAKNVAAELEELSVAPKPVESYSDCILRLVDISVSTTAAEIKQECHRIEATQARLVQALPDSDLEDRMVSESLSQFDRFSLIAHKPNYILPISYAKNPNTILQNADDRLVMDNNEVQFQISLKVPVAKDILDSGWDLYGAYTGRSFWQAYNKEISAPFRDTNHEPEFWFSHPLEFQAGPAVARAMRVGFVHQSNGRSQLLSRSWNRIYADFIFEVDDFSFSFKPWYRLPEDDKTDPLDPAGDDNPDIDDYMGKFELLSAYKYNDHTFSMMVRNNLESNNYGAVDLSWSFPLNNSVKGYVKYFNGYGETLLDYNHRSNRLSVGFVVADWL